MVRSLTTKRSEIVENERRRESKWTIVRLREHWSYDAETGIFTRKTKPRGGKPNASGQAGAVTVNGYRLISVDGVHYLGHRLAWAYVNGEWPSRAVEHINMDRLDNRISNLRLKWGDRGEDGKSILSQVRVKELLSYDSATGILAWKIRTPKSEIGDEAGGFTPDGYRYVGVDGKRYLAHRLAWFYVHGTWPSGHIDHINGGRSDNRIENLRDATVSQNAHNTKKLNWASTTGFIGVARKRSKFMSRITVRNQIIHLGIFSTIAEARICRLLAEKKYLGEFCTYSDERDGILPLGDTFIVTHMRDNRLYIQDAHGVPQEITDIAQFSVVPVTEDGHAIN